MAGDSQDSQARFYFTPEQLANSPSRKCGMDADTELQYRQRAANLIQDMGQRLHVSQLCINTAIVYMHRYYAFHSFTHFHRNSIAAAALFLAAKVEEQPRKLEHVIKVSHLCLNQEPPDTSKEAYQELAQDLVFNENVLLQTLGFDVAIDHPHTHVVKTCGLVKASKELAQTSYFMASNSLHLTTMCLQYRPTVVACFCIHLACKWSRWEIPQSTEGKHWFQYVDKTVTLDLLKQLTDEFLHIFDKCPTRLKRLKSLNNSTQQAAEEQRKAKEEEQAAAAGSSSQSLSSSSSSQHHKIHHNHGHSSSKIPPDHQKSSSRMNQSSQMQQQQRPKVDRPLSGSITHSSAYPVNAPNDKNIMRPPSGSSRDPHYNKNRPHSMGGSSGSSSSQQQQQMQVNMGNKDRHSLGNGQSAVQQQQQQSSHMKHKIHPTNIGTNQQQMDPNQMRKQQQYQQGSKMPPGYNQNTLQKYKSMPSHSGNGGSQSVKQQNHAKHHSLSQGQLPQNLPPSSQSFKLLDDSIITDTTLKSSPHHQQQSKPSSIFSPDWNNSTSSIPMPPLTQNLSNTQQQQQQQQRTSSGSSNIQQNRNNNNNNNNTNNLFSNKSIDKKPILSSSSQPPPLSLIGLPSNPDMDFMKQEKLSNEPPQQLLASSVPTKDTKMSQSSSKRGPGTLDEDREFKMRRLEARMDPTIDPIMPELTQIKQESSMESLIKRENDNNSNNSKWQQMTQQQQNKRDEQQNMMMRQQQQQMNEQQIKRESDKGWKGSNQRVRDPYAPGMNSSQQQHMQQIPPISSYNDPHALLYQDQQNIMNQQQQQQMQEQKSIPPSLMMMQPQVSDIKPPLPPSQSITTTSSVSAPQSMKPLPNVNGIETNPDVIRNLLKESLVDSKFGSSLAPVSTQSTSILPISDNPGPLLSDSVSTYGSSTNLTTTSGLNTNLITQTPISGTDNTDSGSHHRKSEKKKKKEKHKHKEKSKDKDKEERKKHKKDKERHRDKSDQHSSSSQQQNLPPYNYHQDSSMKITIPKNKINLPPHIGSINDPTQTSINTQAQNPPSSMGGSLKLKIPKDRIKSSSTGATQNSGGMPNSNADQGIKIKISRNVIEGYNSNNK